ncbi:hypothetical protein LOY33_10090 [Pseudomonas sp. B21-036]|uniref:hypothetical protein n=1 Tax=unclassified Pseudomonas TaxID=196821 RepID=UPI00215E78A8|nr:hypothetical protein [Pseudomonas sp. B21-036]UVL53223.1 hypothetical protein LOY33_10090 [Pseudomonas sp. B21-036]
MNAHLLTITLGLLLAPATWADYWPGNAKIWKFEPDNFAGIKLNGNNLAEFAPCSADATHIPPEVMCLEQTSMSDYYQVRGAPYIGLGADYQLGMKLNAGQLEYLSISGSAEGFNEVQQLLVSKYGQPNRRENQNLEMRSGLLFNNDILIWDGKHVAITLQRDAEDYRRYSARFSNLDSHPELVENPR